MCSHTVNPMNSFELSLYAKHIYRVRTRDLSDCTTFMKVELIARTLKHQVMYEVRERQAKDGGLMSQGIVKDVFKKRVNSVMSTNKGDSFRQTPQNLEHFHSEMLSRYPRVQMTVPDLKDFLMQHKGMIERTLLMMLGVQTKDIRSHQIYYPIRRCVQTESLNPGLLELFKRVYKGRKDEIKTLWDLIKGLKI